MNAVLVILVLAALGGAYYEHTALQEQTDYTQQQIQDAQAKLDALQANAAKLDSGNSDANQALADLQAKISEVTGQVTPLEGEIDQLKLLSFTPPPPPKPVAPVDPNDLGTITTLTGQTYTHVHLLKTEDDGITFSYDGGITKVLFGVMSPEMQRKFGYDAHEQARLTDAQLRAENGNQPVDTANTSATVPTPAPGHTPAPITNPQVPAYPPTSPTGN